MTEPNSTSVRWVSRCSTSPNRQGVVSPFVEPDLIGQHGGGALLQRDLERTRNAGLDGVLIESDRDAEPYFRVHGAEPIGNTTSATTGRH
jgi:hypothetical protein